jgi:arginyl-tRNA synthetase
VKMSKRAGTFVTLREVVDEVGRDPVRFMLLFRKNDAPLDFDLAKVVEQSKDNPVFYVQYAHARIASVFRQAAEAGMGTPTGEELASADLSGLTDELELELCRRVAQFPRVVEAAAAAHEPHRIAFYLYEAAGVFHALWNKGKDLPQLRFVKQADRNSTMARLALIGSLRTVLASGLAVLGVSAPDEMR